ncbi:MAG: hypothetical protein SPL13_04510 [Clostridia bacterium]|nr:hypothetical protein [Clostridia bacterium]
MENKEVLKKVSEKKAIVGEMEKSKINKSSWIALIVAGVIAVAFMIIEGALKHVQAIYAIGAICFAWAAIFYYCQFFIAKRKFFGIMLGAILESVGFAVMLTFYILSCIGIV